MTTGREWAGLLVHIPVGIFQVFCGWLNPVAGIAFLVAFMMYELNEDWHISDQAWLDIRGYLWGIAMGSIGLFLVEFIF